MRLVIQRVTCASVATSSGVIGSIEKGLCVLVGVGEGDGEALIPWCKDVVLNTKFWEGADGKPWKQSAKDLGLSVLLVSQFTLYGKVYKKGRLDFHHAMSPLTAKELYEAIVSAFKMEIGEERTQTGEFGAMMQLSIENDGPVTITVDSSS